MLKRFGRLVMWLALAVAVLILIAVGGIWFTLRGSLPRVSGELSVTGLAQDVTIARDDLGIPVIRARDRTDLAFATGFVHAQERFFQMDLLRRSAAGELAELVGAGENEIVLN